MNLFWKIWLKGLNFFKCDLEPRIILQFDSNNWIWLKALNPPFQYDSKNWTLFWTWLTETFLSYHNSKNCFVKKYDSQNAKNWTFFSQMTRRLDFSFSNMSDRNNFFFWKKDDSKNWFSENINQIIQTLFWWLKELSSFFFWKDMTHRNWTFFHMTQRIEPFFEYDSKNWIFMIFWLKELNLFWIWLENLNFLNVTHRIELFYWLKEMSSFFQNDKDFVEYDSKNRTFVWICPKELNLFWNFTQWIEHSAQKDSKNWTLKDYLNNKTFLWIGKLGLFFLFDSKNWTFSQYHSKIIDLFDMTHRIELFFFEEYDSLRLNPSFLLESKKMTPFLAWLKEYFFFTYLTQRTMILSLEILTQSLIFVNKNISLRIELFFESSDN